MKKEELSLLLGDIRDDFVAQAHEPVRPRRAAPARRRWSAAACLCLVTAAVLLAAHYLPLKEYKDGDTNYSPSQPATDYQVDGEASYKAPDPGEYFCFVEVNAARAHYAGQEVRFLLTFDLFEDGHQITGTPIWQEVSRLKDLGYDLRFTPYIGADGNRTTSIVVGLFTEEQIQNFPANPTYGYAFRFPTHGDGTPIQLDEPNLITATVIPFLTSTGTVTTP